MRASRPVNDQPDGLLGYLAYVDLPSLGTVGGLLIVDLRARPVEFHCSSPVLPTRTQEILYGPTLRSSMLCDQIGRSLIAQVKQRPQLLVSDEILALELQEFVEIPIAVFATTRVKALDTTATADDMELDSYCVRIANDERFSRTQVHSTWGARAGEWDGLEPLQRIREAIGEAHRAAA